VTVSYSPSQAANLVHLIATRFHFVEEAKLDENYGQTTLEVKADSSFTVLSPFVCATFKLRHGIFAELHYYWRLSMTEDEWSTLPSGIRQHQLVSRV
jgi:hypothetical protein